MGKYGGKERCVQSFGGDTGEKENLEDLGINWRITLK